MDGICFTCDNGSIWVSIYVCVGNYSLGIEGFQAPFNSCCDIIYMCHIKATIVAHFIKQGKKTMAWSFKEEQFHYFKSYANC